MTDTVTGSEPGASTEPILVIEEQPTTDNISTLREIRNSDEEEITCRLEETTLENGNNTYVQQETAQETDDEDARTDEWCLKDKHIFVLSNAGKPIYSRHGSEEKLVTLYGVMQALVSFVQADKGDSIRSMRAGNVLFVFLCKGPLILVAVSRTGETESQLRQQLNHVFDQIVSVLTLTQMNRIYEQRRNYDLRRLLTGAERLTDHLLDWTEREPSVMLGAVRCLPLASSIRDTIGQAITQACSKIKNVVFTILLAQDQLVCLVRMKKYYLHPADLHLLVNLVKCSESFKTAESWTPICLPRFDSSGFLHAHVSYLAEDCQACLMLMSVERDAFFALSQAKQRIVERLRRSNCLEAINEAVNRKELTCAAIGAPQLRHFLYKCRSTAQLYSPAPQAPYTSSDLMPIYQSLIQPPDKPIKLMYRQEDRHTTLAWMTKGFELYAVMEPLIDTPAAIAAVNRLLKWIKKEEDRVFILSAPTF